MWNGRMVTETGAVGTYRATSACRWRGTYDRRIVVANSQRYCLCCLVCCGGAEPVSRVQQADHCRPHSYCSYCWCCTIFRSSVAAADQMQMAVRLYPRWYQSWACHLHHLLALLLLAVERTCRPDLPLRAVLPSAVHAPAGLTMDPPSSSLMAWAAILLEPPLLLLLQHCEYLAHHSCRRRCSHCPHPHPPGEGRTAPADSRHRAEPSPWACHCRYCRHHRPQHDGCFDAWASW